MKWKTSVNQRRIICEVKPVNHNNLFSFQLNFIHFLFASMSWPFGVCKMVNTNFARDYFLPNNNNFGWNYKAIIFENEIWTNRDKGHTEAMCLHILYSFLITFSTENFFFFLIKKFNVYSLQLLEGKRWIKYADTWKLPQRLIGELFKYTNTHTYTYTTHQTHTNAVLLSIHNLNVIRLYCVSLLTIEWFFICIHRNSNVFRVDEMLKWIIIIFQIIKLETVASRQQD